MIFTFINFIITLIRIIICHLYNIKYENDELDGVKATSTKVKGNI